MGKYPGHGQRGFVFQMHQGNRVQNVVPCDRVQNVVPCPLLHLFTSRTLIQCEQWLTYLHILCCLIISLVIIRIISIISVRLLHLLPYQLLSSTFYAVRHFYYLFYTQRHNIPNINLISNISHGITNVSFCSFYTYLTQCTLSSVSQTLIFFSALIVVVLVVVLMVVLVEVLVVVRFLYRYLTVLVGLG